MKITAVINSTSGYRKDIFALHARHLALNIKKLIIGMLSYHFIVFLQFGQNERGLTIDTSLGNLWMQTFKKLPTQAPKINTKIEFKVSGIFPTPL